MALPKRRTSKAKRGKRRSHHRLLPPNLTLCPQCHEPKLPHHVCLHCGSYRGHEVLRLEEKADVLAKDLSGGMKRRLSIACALIHDPQIVFFDEATVGVDPVLRLFFWDYFRKLRDNGKTIIITSHVMDEAERADRIGLMREGILIDEGEPSTLKAKYEVDTIEAVFLKVSYKVKNNE